METIKRKVMEIKNRNQEEQNRLTKEIENFHYWKTIYEDCSKVLGEKREKLLDAKWCLIIGIIGGIAGVVGSSLFVLMISILFAIVGGTKYYGEYIEEMRIETYHLPSYELYDVEMSVLYYGAEIKEAKRKLDRVCKTASDCEFILENGLDLSEISKMLTKEDALEILNALYVEYIEEIGTISEQLDAYTLCGNIEKIEEEQLSKAIHLKHL